MARKLHALHMTLPCPHAGDFERRQPASQMEYQTFSVSYRKTHLAEFVIPQYRFERNIGNAQHLNGDRFSMWFAGGSNQTYQGAEVRTCTSSDMHETPIYLLSLTVGTCTLAGIFPGKLFSNAHLHFCLTHRHNSGGSRSGHGFSRQRLAEAHCCVG